MGPISLLRSLKSDSPRTQRPRGRRPRQPVAPRPLFLEYLEDRTAPSCNPGVSGGVLRANGDNSPNNVILSHNSTTNLTRIEWNTGSGYVYRDFAPSSFSGILMNMGTAADDVMIWSTPANRPVTVDGGGGLDFVTIGENGRLEGIRSEVDVRNPPSGGYTYLAVYDFTDTVGHNVTLSDSAIRFDGGIPAIYYTQSDRRSLTLVGSRGASTYTVFDTPVSGYPGGVLTNLIPDGFATVNVLATRGELAVSDNATNTVLNVNVGNGGSVQAIRGAVSVNADHSYITLNIDDHLDQGDASGLRVPIIDTYTPAGDTEYTRVRDLAPAPISTRSADTERLTVRTGIGEVGPQVRSIGPLLNGSGVLTLEGNSDLTYVTVGDINGSVQGVRGTLRITNPRARTYLKVVDSSDTMHPRVNLNQIIIGDGLYGQIRGLAPAAIQYKYGDILFLGVTTGTGGADVVVSSTDPPTSLQGNGPNTNIYLDASGQHLQGPLSISSNVSGSIAVDISDVGDPNSQTVTLDTSMPDTEHVRVWGLTQVPIDIVSNSLRALEIEGGSGGSTFVVQTTSSYGFPTQIDTGNGNNTVVVHGTSTSPLSVYLNGGQNDTVNLGDAANGLALFQSAVTVVGNQPGDGDTLNVIDQANPNAETYVVTDRLLVTASRTIIGHMENFDTVVLYPSLDPATAVLDAHDPGLYTLVISYDPPPGAPPGGPGGGGGSAVRQGPGLMGETLPIDGIAARFLAETAGEGGLALEAAAPVSDAMLADLFSWAAKRGSAHRALAVDLAWAEALPALIPGPALA
jgi:hypothetical protein